MQFNLKFMREFFKFFHKTENSIEEDDKSTFKSMPVGEITVTTPKEVVKFPLHVTLEDYATSLNTAWVVRTVDGRTVVIFHLDCFTASVNTPNMNGLFATIAHEVGHYLAGHFDNEANKNLDIKTPEQEFFIKLYQSNPTAETEMRYMRCLFFALLKGAVTIAELEADLLALRFVPLAELVHIHTQDFRNEKNPFTVLEKVNRINRLNRLMQDRPINTQGYELSIEFFELGNKLLGYVTPTIKEPAALVE